MKKIQYIPFILIVFLQTCGYSQSYNMNNNPVTTCSGFFYDSGGPANNYGDIENFTKTFTPDVAGSKLRFNFTSFETRNANDYLEIYDGPNTASPLIGTYHTGNSPGFFEATNATGQITFRFISDANQNRPGWVAEISCSAPPPCENQTILGLPFSQTGLNTSAGGNNYNNTNACATSYMNGDDYVFKYTPAANECIDVIVTNTDIRTGVFITQGCPNVGSCVGFKLGSTGNQAIIGANLTAGVDYYIIVSTWPLPDNTPFDILVQNCGPCENQTILALPFSQSGLHTSSGINKFSNTSACSNNYMNGDDYVFKYTPPADECIDVILSNTIDYVGVFITEGCPNTGTCVVSNTNSLGNPSISGANLTGGVTYYITVSTWPLPYNSPFDILVQTCPPPGPCENQTILALPFSQTGMNTSAGGNNYTWTDACASMYMTGDDYLFKYTPASDICIDVLLLNTGPNWVGLFITEGCPDVGTCIASHSSISNPFIIGTSLTAGVTYYITVSTWPPPNSTPFDIIVQECLPPPPNDECINAISLTVNPDLSCAVVTNSATQAATNSGISACVGVGADDDVWFSFVATSTTHTIDISNVTGTSTDMVHEVFSGGCGGLTSIGCSRDNNRSWNGFTIGQTYYVRVYTYLNGQNLYAENFDICIGTPLPSQANNTPCGAIPLNVGVNGNCILDVAVLEATATHTLGVPPPGCGVPGPDVWFTAVVPASGRLIIDTDLAGGLVNFNMAMYSAPDCNGPFNVIECDMWDSQNGSVPMICRTGILCSVPGNCQKNPTITPGSTVYIRVWEQGGAQFGPFSICAYEPLTPGPPSECINAYVIPSIPFTQTGQTTCCAGNNVTSAMACASSYQIGEDFLYVYTPTQNEIVDILISNTLNMTGVFVTEGCPSAGGVCVGMNVQNAGNPFVCGVSFTAGNTYYIMVDTWPGPACTPFNIDILPSVGPPCALNYSPSLIPFFPDPNAGTDITITIDDRFSATYIPIGFDFCFDGLQYTQLLVSSNSYVIFDPSGCATNLPTSNAMPHVLSGWEITAAVPNIINAPRNCIMFPWHDTDPSISGTIKYQILGVAPFRRFVLTFNDVPHYGSLCNTTYFSTVQLKLFETTNNIEMHMTSKPFCTGWNEGRAILGLHNFNGTIAVVPPGYNSPTHWNVTNEAWLFEYNCPDCLVLPVELFAFNGQFVRHKVNKLTWKTASEKNNHKFEIERLNDSGSFDYIGEVIGSGNTNHTLSYEFYDNSAPEEIAYYRLKQFDFDGKYNYSQTISVDPQLKNSFIASISPNPADDLLNVNVGSALANGIFVLVSPEGVEHVLKTDINVDGKDVFTLDVSKFPSGMYLFVIMNNNKEKVFTEKLIIK